MNKNTVRRGQAEVVVVGLIALLLLAALATPVYMGRRRAVVVTQMSAIQPVNPVPAGFPPPAYWAQYPMGGVAYNGVVYDYDDFGYYFQRYPVGCTRVYTTRTYTTVPVGRPASSTARTWRAPSSGGGSFGARPAAPAAAARPAGSFGSAAPRSATPAAPPAAGSVGRSASPTPASPPRASSFGSARPSASAAPRPSGGSFGGSGSFGNSGRSFGGGGGGFSSSSSGRR